MIVLDLYSEVVPQYLRLKSYFGQPFIWCMLHNFGGTLPMYGAIQSVNEVTNCSVCLALAVFETFSNKNVFCTFKENDDVREHVYFSSDELAAGFC